VRDPARAALIALIVVLLHVPAFLGSTASAFAIATALLCVVHAALVRFPHRATVQSSPSHGARGAAAAAGIVAAIVLYYTAQRWLHEILTHPNDAQRADMLVVIELGLRRVLQGRNPYTMYQVPWDVTLPYGPVLWGPYLIPFLLRADLRFVSLAGALFVPAACAIGSAIAAWRSHVTTAGGLLAVAAAIAWSPDVAAFASIAHTPSYWPLLAVFAWLVAGERWYAAAVAGGLLIVARTTMVAMAPVLVAAVWFRDRKRAPGANGLLIASAVVPYLPFLFRDWRALVYALYGSYESLMKGFVWSHTVWAHNTIGLTGLLLRAGSPRLVEPLQAMLMAGVYAASIRPLRRGAPPLPWMIGALFVFSISTLWPVQYVYFDVVLLWAAGAVADAGALTRVSVRRYAAASATVVAAVLLAAIGATMRSDPIVDVGTGEIRPLLYRGFSSDERGARTFAWVEGRSAEILVARNSRRAAAIDILCQPYLPAATSTQHLSVALNGIVLGDLTLRDGWQTVTVDAPPRAWTYGVNRLLLSLSAAVSPAEAGTGDDRRALSVAVDRVSVRSR
jgi:hypothetical protein